MNNKVSALVFKYRRFVSVTVLTMAIVLKHYLQGTTSLRLIIIGLIISLIGIAFRMHTASYLWGKHIDTEVDTDFLCTSGPFAFTRNPLYLGNFIVSLGACISFNEWYGYVIFIIEFTLLYSIVIPFEERFMQEKFGDVYAEYKSHVRRFLPRWRGYKGSTRAAPNFKLGILSEKYHLIIVILTFIIFYLLFVR